MADKLCTKCKSLKDLSEFGRKGKYFQSRCKSCFNEYTRAHYQNNKSYYKDKAKRDAKKHLAISVKLIHEHKNVPCVDCKVQYPYYVMDFDHVIGKKLQIISKMRRNSIDAILNEIAKCEVVCANCHRIRTYKRKFNGQLPESG